MLSRSLFLILFLVFLVQCDPFYWGERHIYVPLMFTLPFTIEPAKDTVLAGDTIWLKTYFPDTLQDPTSKKYYKIPDFNFDTGIYFYKSTGKSTVTGGAGVARSFKFINKIGSIELTESAHFTEGNFLYKDSHYKMEVGLKVPLDPGVYYINLYKSLRDYDVSFLNLPDSNGRRQKAGLEEVFYHINNGETNFFTIHQFHNDILDITLADTSSVLAAQGDFAANYIRGTYTFVVKGR